MRKKVIFILKFRSNGPPFGNCNLLYNEAYECRDITRNMHFGIKNKMIKRYAIAYSHPVENNDKWIRVYTPKSCS